MTQQRYLEGLFAPRSVALVGATDRPGSLGRIVYENLLEGDFRGDIHAINLRARTIFARPSYPSLRAVGKPIDLAVIAVPHTSVRSVLEDCAVAGIRVAVLMGAQPETALAARRWRREILEVVRGHRIALVGHRAFGIIRPGIGLNASITPVAALPGRLALVAQSGALCAAMLDFARPAGIGFSTVVAPGASIDVDFGELLDALVLDPETDAIVLYVEEIRDARRFLSALRAAARSKPVAVLKAGRSGERASPAGAGDAPPSPDAVFGAALRRSGTVRVGTYTQLFAAARALASARIPRGDRVAIVTNGRGPATLAADAAIERGVPLASFTPALIRSIAAVLPSGTPIRNPLNVGGDAPPDRFAAAAAALLRADEVDAVIAVHVPRPASSATDTARALANVTRGVDKPVLGAWLGAINRRDAQEALEAGGIADFFTPENAVEAFSFLAAYRRHQRLLLEVPPPMPEPEVPDQDAAERIRRDLAAENRSGLTAIETQRLLASFGLPVPAMEAADSLSEALAAARKQGYPVRLALDAAGSAMPPSCAGALLRNARMVTRAYGELRSSRSDSRRARRVGSVVVVKEVTSQASYEVAIGVHVDPTFGSVITLGSSGPAARAGAERTILLPPLNRRLIVDLIADLRAPGATAAGPAGESDLEPLIGILLQVSAMVCSLPWISSLSLDPVRVNPQGAWVAGAKAFADARRRLAGGYRHMAIHPYPVEQAADVTLRDGSLLHVRPIRPEDADMERRFVANLSEQSRYFRFFYRLSELTPAMLARFTQVDYDREQALVALTFDPRSPEIVGVARTIAGPDQRSAEFAVVVADAWQRRGIARILMQRLISYARTRGLARLEGMILRSNTGMLRFVEAMGFVAHENREERDVVNVVLELSRGPRAR